MDSFRQNLEIRDTGKRGKGVFSKVTIAPDTYIFELGGSVIKREDLIKHPPQDIELFFQIGKDTFLSKSGDLDDYMNHSCNPNCGLYIVGYRAFVKTLHQINPGVEITWDYSSTSTDKEEEWSMKCTCGDYNCRKVISGFHTLSKDVQQRYINLKMVPHHLTSK